MKKMKIGIVMQSPDIGGAETYLVSLVKQFKKEGNSVLLATNRGKFFDYTNDLGIKRFSLPFILDINGNLRGLIKSTALLPFGLTYYSWLLWQFRKEKVDVILLTSFTEKLVVTFLSIFFRIPVVWIEYGPLSVVFKRNLYIPKLIYILIAVFPKKIIVPSENTLRSLRKDAFVRSSKLILIPCGVEPRIKSKRPIPEELQEKFVVGSISRLTREKGQDYLIRAIPKVLEKIPSSYFIIIGSGPDKDYFQNLVKELRLQKNVIMPGFVEDIEFYYSVFDVFVFPTVWDLEGFGLVIPEAMKHKIPIIGTNHGPVPEIVDDNINGIIVKKRNEDDIASAIIRLGLDEDLRKKMGENGFKKTQALYNIEKNSSRILEVFYEACS